MLVAWHWGPEIRQEERMGFCKEGNKNEPSQWGGGFASRRIEPFCLTKFPIFLLFAQRVFFFFFFFKWWLGGILPVEGRLNGRGVFFFFFFLLGQKCLTLPLPLSLSLSFCVCVCHWFDFFFFPSTPFPQSHPISAPQLPSGRYRRVRRI